MDNLIKDLDDYFSRNYDNYAVISRLKSYTENTKLHLKRVYTLPDISYNYLPDKNIYKLFFQKNRETLLNELKATFVDNSFEFAAIDLTLKQIIKNLFNKKKNFTFLFFSILQKYGYIEASVICDRLNLTKHIYKKIKRYRAVLSKRMLFKVALVLGLSFDDNAKLMQAADYFFDFSSVLDVIVMYLLENRVHSKHLIERAFEEYNLKSLI